MKFADIRTADSDEERERGTTVICATFTSHLCRLTERQQKMIFTNEKSNFHLIKILTTLKLRAL